MPVADSLISANSVWGRVLGALRNIGGDGDPAPWFDVTRERAETFGRSDPQAYIRNRKLDQRAMRVLLRSLRAGHLTGLFSTGRETRVIPGWAWVGVGCHDRVWDRDFLPLPLFLPDEWEPWFGATVLFDEAAFEQWLGCQDLSATDGLDPLPVAYDEAERPADLVGRFPPNLPFVSLSEAVSWIALGFSARQERLFSALAPGGEQAQVLRDQLADAADNLAEQAKGGGVEIIGRKVKSGQNARVETKRIKPVKFANYGRFDVLENALRWGGGISDGSDPAIFDNTFEGSAYYAAVQVKRTDLLKAFPPAEQVPEADASGDAAPDKSVNANPMRTGDPGRPPKGYHLYVAEHIRRCDAGEAMDKVAHEAGHLARWYALQYPNADPVSAGTVENRIRSRHRQYCAPKPHEIIASG